MCIICVKPTGVVAPTQETIEQMFDHNPDGFGFMHNGNGYVQIEKGFMNLKAVKHRLNKLYKEIDVLNTTIVYHFRITTSGGSKDCNTHPFPISPKTDDIRSLKIRCPIGVAHNGVISIDHPVDMSDTMSFVKNELSLLYRSNKRFYEDDLLMKMIEHRIGSKMCFLLPSGQTYLLGNFTEDGGLWYSNSTYKESRYAYMYDEKYWEEYDRKYGSKYSRRYDTASIRKDARNVKYLGANEVGLPDGVDDGEWTFKGTDENGKCIYSWSATGTNDSIALTKSDREIMHETGQVVFEYPRDEIANPIEPFSSEDELTDIPKGKTYNRFRDHSNSEYELLMELVGKDIEVEMPDGTGKVDIINIGDVYEGELAIDSKGYVYEYDKNYQTYSPTLEKGLRFWADGEPVIFNKNKAEWEVIW